MSDGSEILDLKPIISNFRTEVPRTLLENPKHISPKFFYDDEGSRLFDEITRLDEYYPTRSEMEILESECGRISEFIGKDALVIELGGGNGDKGLKLLRCLSGTEGYVFVDISKDSLNIARDRMTDAFPDVNVRAVWADYTENEVMERLDFPGKKTIVFLGSTIGNMEPDAAKDFLTSCRKILSPGEKLLVGVDLKKDRSKIELAYNDPGGVTARFNLNLISRINREFGTGMDVSSFSHLAFYNDEKGRIEMHLKCLRSQKIFLDGKEIEFSAGETIHTENSYKYSREDLFSMLRKAGFPEVGCWTDSQGNFGLFSAKV